MQDAGSYNQNHIKILPPSYNEVCLIINKLKSNKAEGTDNIIPELYYIYIYTFVITKSRN
jgi:hypothetical protein